MPSVDGRAVIRSKTPKKAGEDVARAAIEQWANSDCLEIDLRDLVPGMLISSFFNGFFELIRQLSPENLEKAYSVVWLCNYDFQKEAIKRAQMDFMSNYKSLTVEEVYGDLGSPDTWDWKHEPTSEDDALRYEAQFACSCGCQACGGTGWYRMGHSYKECCEPCPIHHNAIK